MSENYFRSPLPETCDICGDYLGGSHYHCAKCNKRTGMMGHYTSYAGHHKGKIVHLPEAMFSCDPGYEGECERAMSLAEGKVRGA